MGKLSNGVQRRKRDGTSHLVIDFRFRDKDGREQRYRRDARVQTRAGAEAEARRLMEIAHATGTLELRAEAQTCARSSRTRSSRCIGRSFDPGHGGATKDCFGKDC